MQAKSVTGWLNGDVTFVPLSVAHNDAENMCISQDLTIPGVESLPCTGQAISEVLFMSECCVLKETMTSRERIQGDVIRMAKFPVSGNVRIFVRTGLLAKERGICRDGVLRY